MSQHETRIKVGLPPVNFSMPDIYGNDIWLSDYRVGKVMLSFFRNTLCPFCNLHVHSLLDREAYYRARNMKMIFFFQSKREDVLKSSNLRTLKSPTIIIADPDMTVYKKYGIESSWLKVASAYTHPDTFKKLGTAITTSDVSIGYSTKNNNSIVPADILIKDFTVVRAHYGRHIADHLPISEIDKFANS